MTHLIDKHEHASHASLLALLSVGYYSGILPGIPLGAGSRPLQLLGRAQLIEVMCIHGHLKDRAFRMLLSKLLQSFFSNLRRL